MKVVSRDLNCGDGAAAGFGDGVDLGGGDLID